MTPDYTGGGARLHAPSGSLLALDPPGDDGAALLALDVTQAQALVLHNGPTGTLVTAHGALTALVVLHVLVADERQSLTAAGLEHTHVEGVHTLHLVECVELLLLGVQVATVHELRRRLKGRLMTSRSPRVRRRRGL